MAMLAERIDHVIGVDPDRDRLTIAVIDAATTGVVAETVVAADPAGYTAALSFAAMHSCVERRVWSIEGAGSYGAGLAVTVADAGSFVDVDVDVDGTCRCAARSSADRSSRMASFRAEAKMGATTCHAAACRSRCCCRSGVPATAVSSNAGCVVMEW